MTMLEWRSISDSTLRSDDVDFGVRDAKGRAVGGYASVVADLSLASALSGAASGWHVRTWSTRDGKDFGAIPRGTTFRGTEEQAKAYAEKKLEAAKKRQIAQFGGRS